MKDEQERAKHEHAEAKLAVDNDKESNAERIGGLVKQVEAMTSLNETLKSEKEAAVSEQRVIKETESAKVTASNKRLAQF